MSYLIALEVVRNMFGLHSSPTLLGTRQIIEPTIRTAGVRYNVIRRSAHKSVESMLKKFYEDRNAGRIGEWFGRWRVEVSAADVDKFRRQSLDPILENLLDDHEWWSASMIDRADPFDNQLRARTFSQHRQRHFRAPFFYNPLLEGGECELDEYLETGSERGLRRTDEMFPELNKVT